MTEQPETLALEISVHATSIFRCEGDIPKECIGSVTNDDPEFDHKLAQVAGAAWDNLPKSTPTEVWMAEDKIVLRHVRVEAEDTADRYDEAAGAMSAITPYRPEDLCFALGVEDSEGYTPVAAVPNKILDETMALARSIGFNSAVLTTTDDIDGYSNRPVWTANAVAEPSRARFAQAAAFAAAISLPFVLAGAANQTSVFASQIQAFLAFTPSFSQAPRAPEIQTAAAIGTSRDTNVAPGTVTDAAAPSVFAAAPTAPVMTSYVQRHVRQPMPAGSYERSDLSLPVETSGFEAPGGVPAFFVPDLPAAPDLMDVSAIVAPPSLDRQLTNINFLVAMDAPHASPDPAPFATNGQLANLDVEVLDSAPRVRPGTQKSIAPLQLAAPAMRPLPPLPEERYNSQDLPVMSAPRDQAAGNIVTLKSGSIYRPNPVEGISVSVEPDIAASLEQAYQQRRESAIAAALNNSDSADAARAMPALRLSVPVPDAAGAIVQIRMLSSGFGPATTDDPPPAVTALKGTSIGAHQAIEVAEIPPDAETAIDQRYQRRAEEARLASLIIGDADLPATPVLRPRAAAPAAAESAGDEAPGSDDPAIFAAEAASRALGAVEISAAQARPARFSSIASSNIDPSAGGISAGSGVVASYLPLHRPKDLAARAAEIIKKRESTAARVAARQEPQRTTPSEQLRIPSSARVARVATISDGINFGDVSLIGIFGKSSNRYALVRSAQGRIQKVQRGAKFSGWTVSAIGEDAVRLIKRSQTKVLRLPN